MCMFGPFFQRGLTVLELLATASSYWLNFATQHKLMPSFDIVSKVDAQAVDNAVNVTTKEITNRFDFKGSHVVIDLNKKDFKLNLETDDDMKMRQLIDVLI